MTVITTKEVNNLGVRARDNPHKWSRVSVTRDTIALMWTIQVQNYWHGSLTARPSCPSCHT